MKTAPIIALLALLLPVPELRAETPDPGIAEAGLPDVAAMSPGEAAAFARSLDRTGSPEVRALREELKRRRESGIAAASNGMTVTDFGRVTVLRDAEGGVWGRGTSFDSIINGIQGTPAAFFQTHPDADPDFVVIIQDWLNSGFLGAFYMPMENDVTGIGYANQGGAETFDDDPTNSLEGLMWLNGVQILSTDLFIGILWGQEFGHRWGSFVHFMDGPNRSTALLGRDEAHWSYYLDTDWSWFEGNDWIQNADTTWTTATDTFDASTHYSPLDLYLMGLVGTADVPSFTLLTGPSGGPGADAAPAAWQGQPVTVTAQPRTVTIQDVIAAEGPRVPSHLASPKSFDVAVLYVLREDDRITDGKLAAMESILDAMLASWNADVGGLATVSFGPGGTANQAPVATLLAPERADQHREVNFDARDASDPEGTPLRYFWRFDPETPFEEGGPVARRTFGSAGTKEIEVSIRDEQGGERLLAATLEVDPAPAGCGCALADAVPHRLAWLFALFAVAGVAVARRRRG